MARPACLLACAGALLLGACAASQSAPPSRAAMVVKDTVQTGAPCTTFGDLGYDQDGDIAVCKEDGQ